MNEYYDETPTDRLRSSGPAWSQNWDGWQRLVQTAQSMRDDFFGVTYGTSGDTAAMTFGKASFLLDWNGVGGAFMYGVGSPSGSDPTSTAWTTDIGTPAATKQQVGVGWMRQYTAGVALVNPSPSGSQTFQLGGSYTTSSGLVLTSVTLQPTTGMILQARNSTGAATTASAGQASAAPGSNAGTTTMAAPATGTTTSLPGVASPGGPSLGSFPGRPTPTPRPTTAERQGRTSNTPTTPASAETLAPVMQAGQLSGKPTVGWDAATLRTQLHGLIRWWRASGGGWQRIKKTGAFKIWRTLGGT